MSFINRYNKNPHAYYDTKKFGSFIYGVGQVTSYRSPDPKEGLEEPLEAPAYEEVIDTKNPEGFVSVVSETLSGPTESSPTELEEKPLELSLESKSAPVMLESSGEESKAATTTTLEGLITKVDTSGNLIWERQYTSDDGKGIRFRKVVPCTNDDILVLGVTADFKDYHVSRVDSNGNLLWRKYYPTNQASNVHQNAYLESMNNGNFYLVISDIHSEGQTVGGAVIHIDNHLFVLNGSGDIIKQRSVAGADRDILLRGTTSDGDQLVIYGTQYNRDYGHLGVVMFFNSALSLVNKFAIKSSIYGTGNVAVWSAEFEQGMLSLGGSFREENTNLGFVLRNSVSSFLGNFTHSGLALTSPYGNFTLDSGKAYANYTTGSGTSRVNIVSKLQFNVGAEWTKKFNDDAILYLNQVDGEDLIFHGYFYDEYLGASDLDFDTCKTTDTKTISTIRRSMYRLDISDYILRGIEYRAVDEKITPSNLSPTIDEICPSSGGSIPIKEVTSLQSPNFFLQSTGSLGVESTKGIHLRWIFAGALGEKHLPKRDYAANTNNFNKPNDVVSVYRAPYVKSQFSLNLLQNPTQVNDLNRYWVYQTSNTRSFHVYFRNASKYDQVRATINPATNASAFIQSYGDEVIEIENKDELFFAVEMRPENSNSSSSLQTETLSVPENVQPTLKTVSSRKTYSSAELSNVRMVCENGRSIRFKTYNCDVSEILFEFYGDFIADTNKNNSWTPMGDYGLTTQDSVAEALLEPVPGAVDRHWQRFNDNAYVKVENYEKKWNGTVEPWDRNIKQIVETYIDKSNALDNPRGIDTVTFGPDDDEPIEISTLDQLNFAAYDYHIARMLGLGFLDLDPATLPGAFVYIAEYTTFGDLEDGLGAREVHHLSMGLPTALANERLPLPVDLDTITPGAFFGNEGESESLTGPDGYTHGGTSRFVTLYAKSQPEDQVGSFYQFTNEFSSSDVTNPVYAGIEYQHSTNRITNPIFHVWQKPELSNDLDYQNAVPSGEMEHNETRYLQVPENNMPFYVHRQDRSDFHYYSSYGINWFSRATPGNEVLEIETQLQPVNTLLPPSNVNPLLVRQEQPLFLTSMYDQERWGEINPTNSAAIDETLVRVTFDYHAAQDMIKRLVPLDSPYSNSVIENDTSNPDILFPNADEVFADEIDVYFRGELPNNVTGRALPLDMGNQPASNILTRIETTDYIVTSGDPDNGNNIISPVVAPGTEDNYVGGVFIIGDQQHIIYSVVQGGQGPVFTVYKKEISDAIVNNIPAEDADNLQTIEITEDGLFMAVENMQNPSSWGTPHPLPLSIEVGYDVSDIHREVIQRVDEDGFIEREVEKTRGIWSKAANGHTTIEKELEPIEQYDANGVLIVDADGNPVTVDVHRGMYKIIFHGIELEQHPQYKMYNVTEDSVEWCRGVARIFTDESYNGGTPNNTRKVLPVARIDNIKHPIENPNPGDLVIYVTDPNFPEVNEDGDASNDVPYDYIQLGSGVSVNFYPGYKVYFYNNDTYGLDEDTILPDAGEGVRYSIFGMRSRHNRVPDPYGSKVSVPSMMFAQEIIEPQPPRQPQGTLYATRPDFFGRSTYTLTTEYEHQPHGVLFYRANDEALLNALYKKETVAFIRGELAKLGGNDEEWFTDRWQNFLDFDTLQGGDYETFPPAGPAVDFQFKFPEPDKPAFFDWANAILADLGQPLITNTSGTIPVGDPQIFNFVKGAIFSAFVPLTEVPIIYQHIKGNSYTPVNERQVVRDENGYVLPPSDERFKMAPMMKRMSSNPHKTQFVDFNLDGTSRNIYFYGVRELGSLMKMGEYSPFLGPIKLVNTNAPETPEIKRVMPILENTALQRGASMQLEINAYAEVENIKKLTIYRALNKLDAQSVRTMQKVKTIDLEAEGILGEKFWRVHDNFEGLDEVPYGDALFYRVTVSRQVEYADKDGNVIVEYQPSKASKITATVMVEAMNPPAPTLCFDSDVISSAMQTLEDVVLRWDKTCYKGKYYVYKMNTQGNWVEIKQLTSNDDTIVLPLASTELENGMPIFEDTYLGNGTLKIQENGNPIYHHFKVVAENTAGMLSTEENILSILQDYRHGYGYGCLGFGPGYGYYLYAVENGFDDEFLDNFSIGGL